MQALRPMFLLWAFCMLLTASTELAPQGMQSLVLEKTAGMNGTYVLIYTSFMMFVLRHFAGPIAHRFSPVGMLTGSAILSAIGLYSLELRLRFQDRHRRGDDLSGWASSTSGRRCSGVTAERFPRGGAFLLGLMGCVGNLAIGVVQPWMGRINDQITLGGDSRRIAESDRRRRRSSTGKRSRACRPTSRHSSRRRRRKGRSGRSGTSSALPVLLIFIFGGIALSDRARGGYKPEVLVGKEMSPAELASDY